MAPIKFEENIKEKLEKRIIEPSSTAWDALSQRLDNNESKSGEKGYVWLAIAASIIGLSFIMYPFFSGNTVSPNDPNNTFIVNENDNNKTEVENKIDKSLEIQQPVIKEDLAEIKPLELKKEIKDSNKGNDQYLANKTTESPINILNQAVISSNENKGKIDNIITKESINAKSPEQKFLAFNKNEETITSNVTSIDSLLASAQQDLAANKSNNNVSIPIDHNELLLEVEDDLDRSLRDKLFNTVRKGYSSIKQEIAERND